MEFIYCVLHDWNVLAGTPNMPLCMLAQACHGSEKKEEDRASSTRHSSEVMELCVAFTACYRNPPPLEDKEKTTCLHRSNNNNNKGEKKNKKQHQASSRKSVKTKTRQHLLLNFWIFSFFRENLKILQCPGNVSHSQDRRM